MLGRDLINLCRSLKDGAMLLVVPCAKARGNGHKLRHGTFPMNITKYSLTAGD